jgi:preprotein translocase subunit SecE
VALSDQFAKLRGGLRGDAPASAPSKPATPRERVTPLQYLREVREELGKVSWPKRSEVVQGTVRVIIVSLLFAALLGAVDFGAQRGLDKLLSRLPETVAPATTTEVPLELPEGIPLPPGLEDQAQ